MQNQTGLSAPKVCSKTVFLQMAIVFQNLLQLVSQMVTIMSSVTAGCSRKQSCWLLVKAAAHEACFNIIIFCLLAHHSKGFQDLAGNVLYFKSSKLARKTASSDVISIPTILQIANQSSHLKNR